MVGVLAFYSDDPCSNSDEFFLQNCLKITKEAGADPLKTPTRRYMPLHGNNGVIKNAFCLIKTQGN